MMSDKSDNTKPIYTHHSRNWGDNLYVYPVISRRSGGLSIGINLNPDKSCNFNCAYCQIDRTTPPKIWLVDLDRLRSELEQTIKLALTGQLFDEPPFDTATPQQRIIRDIAFSGDGEPTHSPQFPKAVQIAADLHRSLDLQEVKLVLITNATCLNIPPVRRALELMDANNGQIWAKLDAGTEEYFKKINRANISLQTILDNLLEAAQARPIVIQSLWTNLNGQPPPNEEIDALANNLRTIIDRGGQIDLVQIYTTARQPAEDFVTPLTNQQLRAITDRIKTIVDVPINTFTS
ncbi:MAG: radical SAM protein [Planctomycetota bacterium]|jgi:wyosine [tRNA(Phe)-imidazoG37] synthetase (radical SAM superfamily)